ncbi:MAG TPA: galactokinase family protein, partial [Armatimonadota bacterium]|nr:galactokinase family protein [Armatimonadota bacterium]
YACGIGESRELARRLARLDEEFETRYGTGRDIMIFSAPGRTEIGGNHTDHQGGRVLAAGIGLDAVAVAAKTDGTEIRVKSAGFREDRIEADDFAVKSGEKKHVSCAHPRAVRGICRAGVLRRRILCLHRKPRAARLGPVVFRSV